MPDSRQLGARTRGFSSAAACFAGALLASCNAFDGDLLGRSPDGSGAPGGGSSGSGSDGDVTASGQTRSGDAAVANTAGAPAGGTRDAALPSDDGGTHDAAAAATDASVERDASTDLDAGTDAGGACMPASISDYCSELPELDQPPVIDGVLDCGPPLLDLALAGWKSAAAQPTGLTAQLAAAYRPDGLYVYVEVHGQAPVPHPSDALIYCGDAIELYVDADGVLAANGDYDAPGSMQLIVAAPASDTAPNPHAERFLQGATQGAWTSGAYALVWLADGYALEAFLAAADLGLASWSPSDTLGLDLVLDVAGPAASPDLGCGRQLGQYFLRLSAATPSGCSGEPWCDTRAFCVTTLQ